MLTPSLGMTIIFIIERRIYLYQFKRSYQKNKKFFALFIKNLKCTVNFEYFEKNEPHSLSIFQIIHSERRGYLKLALAKGISQTDDRSGFIMKSLKLIVNHCNHYNHCKKC